MRKTGTARHRRNVQNQVFALTLPVAAGLPGPRIAALVARVLTSGVRDVLPFLAAMWLGEVLWLTWR